MKTIFKYKIIGSEVLVSAEYRVLKVGVQGSDLYAWILVDPEAEANTILDFELRGTGWTRPDSGIYVDTLFQGDYYVWHVFYAQR